jgi:hypothetical protein
MIRVGGVWVHQGTAEPGTDWEHILDEIREERIQVCCQTAQSGSKGEEREAKSE